MTFIIAGYVLNPSDRPCSVHGRVKGGTPGRALVSQAAKMNVPLAERIAGCVMTEAPSGARSSSALCSQTVITDGDWHRVGLTVDGATRNLYVDDVLVAEDTQSGTAGYFGGVNLGCGKSMTPGTFWSGLIDDVQIYNRVVKP